MLQFQKLFFPMDGEFAQNSKNEFANELINEND